MARKFNSNNYTFRPTSLASAMQSAGLIKQPHLVREAKQSITAVNEDGDAYLKERMIPCRAVA